MTTPSDPLEPADPQEPSRPDETPLYGTPPVSPYGSRAADPTPSPGGPPVAPPPYGFGSAWPGQAPATPTGTQQNNLATWSLVLGIVGVLLACGCAFVGLAASIPALLLSKRSKEAVARGQADNGSLAQAGLVLAWIGIGLAVLRTVTAIGSRFVGFDS